MFTRKLRVSQYLIFGLKKLPFINSLILQTRSSRVKKKNYSQQLEVFERKQLLTALHNLVSAHSGLKIDANLTSELKLSASQLVKKNGYIIITDVLQDHARIIAGKNVEIICRAEDLDFSNLKKKVFIPFFKFDQNALPFLEKIKQNGGVLVPPILGQKNEYRFISQIAYDALYKTFSQLSRISHWSTQTHENIAEAFEITKNISGDFVEIGVYKGGTALTALNCLVVRGEKARKVFLLDTFSGFSHEESESVDPIWADTHSLYGTEETYNYVKKTLLSADYPFELIVADIIKDELPSQIQDVVIAHIDVDSYEATSAALRKIHIYIRVGGMILLEDPSGTPLLYGAFLAMNEFLDSNEGKKYVVIYKTSHYFLLRIF